MRGSTGLAERVSAGEFRALLQAYCHVAATAVDESGGIVDKCLGDGVMALFIPVFTGENHARRAIAAGRAILAAVDLRPSTGRATRIPSVPIIERLAATARDRDDGYGGRSASRLD